MVVKYMIKIFMLNFSSPWCHFLLVLLEFFQKAQTLRLPGFYSLRVKYTRKKLYKSGICLIHPPMTMNIKSFFLSLSLLLTTALCAGNPTAIIETSMGTITVKLNRDKAPASVENFVRYAEAGRYNNTIFHRVISNFMIQGGGFSSDMQKVPTYDPIENEADNGLSNKRGTIAMARTNVINSATNQFFINVKDNNFLDHRDKSSRGYGYAVFGKVTAGMNVVDQIKMVETASCGPHQNCPVTPVIIKSVTIKKN